jgi:hypothetical protein
VSNPIAPVLIRVGFPSHTLRWPFAVRVNGRERFDRLRRNTEALVRAGEDPAPADAANSRRNRLSTE